MRIAFLFIAEAYQVFHGYPVAIELAKIDGVDLTVFYNDPETPHHIGRINDAVGTYDVALKPLKKGFASRFIQALKVFGLARPFVLADNKDELFSYDCIIAVEFTATHLIKKPQPNQPKFIYIPHGAGDRDVTWDKRIGLFDVTLPAAEKTLKRFRDEKLSSAERSAAIGYVKSEITKKIADRAPSLFPDKRPIVLYNPHKAPKVSSWTKAIEPMLHQFSAQQDFSLVIAPHIKKFRRRSRRYRDQWEKRKTPHIHIDTGSDRSVDNTYTEIADIYVGDVSSQVYEFTVRPRPCVFLNLNKIDWQTDPNFAFWHMGEVIEDVRDLLPAIQRAHSLFPRYKNIQKELTKRSIGRHDEGSAKRAAEHIYHYMKHGALPPAASKPD